MLPPKTGFARIVAASRYSLDGLCTAWRGEAAFRQVCLLALVLFITALYVEYDWQRRMILILPALGLVVIELLNSAIEAAVDHSSLEQHPLAKAAKDMGSAAQCVGLGMVAMVWFSWLWFA